MNYKDILSCQTEPDIVREQVKMADNWERTRVVRKHPHLNTSSLCNPAISERTENDEKRTRISFVDWLNEMDAQVSKSDNSNNPFKCSSTPCPTSYLVNRPTCGYETLSQQTSRATNPFISGAENEHMHDSGINTQGYTKTTSANLNYPHSVCTELKAKRMLQGTPTINCQPCKHDVCAAQHGFVRLKVTFCIPMSMSVIYQSLLDPANVEGNHVGHSGTFHQTVGRSAMITEKGSLHCDQVSLMALLHGESS